MSSPDTLFLAREASIRLAISTIEVSAAKIALVVDANRALLGTVTDGDIRRGILRGIGLDEPVSRVMNERPTVATLGQPQSAILARMRRDHFRHIPVVDEKGRVVRVEVLSDLIEPKRRENLVVLMAGGLGQRLQPLTHASPKSMLQVGGKPILEVILETFVEYGFSRFLISVNYMREMVEAHFGNGDRWGVAIEYLREDQPLGTAGALSLLPERPSRPFIVMNGDILTKIDFDSLLAYHREYGAPATTTVREFAVPVPYGVVEVDGARMVRMREKPVLQFLVNAGIYVLEPDVLPLIPKGVPFDMPQLLDGLLSAARPVSVFPIREYWIDIGRIEDFKRANGEFDTVFG